MRITINENQLRRLVSKLLNENQSPDDEETRVPPPSRRNNKNRRKSGGKNARARWMFNANYDPNVTQHSLWNPSEHDDPINYEVSEESILVDIIQSMMNTIDDISKNLDSSTSIEQYFMQQPYNDKDLFEPNGELANKIDLLDGDQGKALKNALKNMWLNFDKDRKNVLGQLYAILSSIKNNLQDYLESPGRQNDNLKPSSYYTQGSY